MASGTLWRSVYYSGRACRNAGGINHLVTLNSFSFPALVAAARDRAVYRFLEFFTANTRRADVKAVSEFYSWMELHGLASITVVSSIHIAAYVEELGHTYAAPTVKPRLAAIRMMFDWLATGGVLPFNPATAVRGPKHVVKSGKTPVLAPDEAYAILDAIDVSTAIGLRDRALIGIMIYTFARIGAATVMRVEDVFVQNRRLWVRLHEKGGKAAALPCHHNLEAYLHAYLDWTGIQDDKDGPLFRPVGRGTALLTRTPLMARDARMTVQRRAAAAKIATRICNHTFRATGNNAYLKNGGTLERAGAIADVSALNYSLERLNAPAPHCGEQA